MELSEGEAKRDKKKVELTSSSSSTILKKEVKPERNNAEYIELEKERNVIEEITIN
jgi:hypothetical protein